MKRKVILPLLLAAAILSLSEPALAARSGQYAASVNMQAQMKETDQTAALQRTMDETRAYMLSADKNPTVGSEWFVLGLARSGVSLSDAYFATYYNHFANYLEEQKGILTESIKYSEYSKAILSVTSIGRDARNIGGYNLFSYLADMENVTAQGINGPVWALIALKSNPQYTIPAVSGVKDQTTEQKLVDCILSQEISGGGWDLMGTAADPDMTAMAIQALAPYYQKSGYENVTAAIDRGLSVLSGIQTSTGGFETGGVETLESGAQVLVALCALKIDPLTDARFVKNGCTVIDNLLTYHISGSGFMHVKQGNVNGMATEQGYYALAAYQRFKNGQTGLYDMSDVSMAAGEKGDGKGTGLEKPKDSKEKTEKKEKSKKKKSSEKKSSGKKSSDKKSVGKTTQKKTAGKIGKTAPKTSSKKKGEDKENTDGKSETQSGGWDFQAEAYVEPEQTQTTGEPETTESQPQTEPGEKQSLPGGVWLIIGIAVGAAGKWIVTFLYTKKKGGKAE